jgi:phosphatidylethanolamine N-methyltransferase
VPIEYNCWLLYRALVDFVLLNDFFTYFLFVFAFAELPASFGITEFFLYSFGFVLVVFNWFIKMDALRVVKDFAWCKHSSRLDDDDDDDRLIKIFSLSLDWGDFFFLVDSELTFDGVFQMAPHPMYSIG